MTKPDFTRLATALQSYRKGFTGKIIADESYEDLVDQIALACQDCDTDHGFDYDKFRDACYNES
jgi:hypothetical protein